MRRIGLLVLAASLSSACTDSKTPIAATAIAGPTPLLVTPALPTSVPGVLTLQMPIDPGDGANASFGIAPFGYHAADHAEAGHTGWDIEYRAGAIVRAAAAGTVEAVTRDAATGRSTVQIEHVVGTHHYRTTYSSLATVASGLAAEEVVRAGEALGSAAGISHFQLDDFEYHREVSSPNAVSPEPFLTAQAKSLFDALWSRAVYTEELVEPFATNPRQLAFPASRTWMRAGGDGIAGIQFTRRTVRSTDYDYAILAESGTALETGTAIVSVTARPNATIDLISATSRRLGIYDVVSNEMRLSLADPGSPRPSSLTAVTVLRTVQ